MKWLENAKIGKKLTAVLGGTVALLTAMAGLSLWGDHVNSKATETVIERLTKARLAERVSADTATIATDLGWMILTRKATTDRAAELNEAKADRVASLEEFRRLADTPTSIKHGADMAEQVAQISVNSAATLRLCQSGDFGAAMKSYEEYQRIYSVLRPIALEASKFQQDLVDQAEKDRKQSESNIRWLLILGALFATGGATYCGLILTKSIAGPIAKAVEHFGRIAQGDLSQNAQPEYLARQDEIGNLARAEQKMIDSLRDMVRQISGGVQVLSSSATELTATSTQMTSGARSASDKAHSVSAAAEEMSSNITSVAAGMEQTTTNLAHVASSTEQMTSTIGEIAQNSEKARRITEEATRQAARITDQINELGQAAREIGKVTETITEISSQTNLLALNATIEAARAGSAGKGFAVVATEIKTLAQQTAAATEDIKARIAGVQAATAGGITEIGKISEVIRDVSSIVASIAAAIEEQSVATKDIARHIAEASAGVAESNTRVAETSHVSREIARDIVTVDQAAGDMASGSGHVKSSADELSKTAETLRLTLAHFNA